MGRPKAWLPFGSDTLLQSVVRILREVVQPVVVVASPGQDIPELDESIEVVRDAQHGRGPLQGLLAGLETLQGKADAAYVSSCDVPFLRPAFVRRVIALLGERWICVPHVGNYHHPLAAVYRLEVVSTVRDCLEANRLRPFFLFEAVPTRVVEAHELRESDPTFESLRNLNTPEDYERAAASLSHADWHVDGF